MRYSFIIPVYNRPEELQELLESIMRQSLGDYEVIVVEDGSTRTSEEVIQRFIPQIYSLYYYQIPNGGPSRARNIGANYAKGDYIIILDSDVVLPEGYLLAVDKALSHGDIDAFGGPDTASEDFTPIQKAINYAMTSTLTTGGIRGGSADAMEQFKPRSFNLGCRRALFLQLGGFDVGMRFGEDIDFSLRLQEAGARTVLIPEAYVYHKRRVDLRRFFKQVHNSGIARDSPPRQYSSCTLPPCSLHHPLRPCDRSMGGHEAIPTLAVYSMCIAFLSSTLIRLLHRHLI